MQTAQKDYPLRLCIQSIILVRVVVCQARLREYYVSSFLRKLFQAKHLSMGQPIVTVASLKSRTTLECDFAVALPT